MKRGGGGAKRTDKGISKMKGTQVQVNTEEDDQEKATSLVDVIEACEIIAGVDNESVHRAYMDCLKQFYTTAELHNYRSRYVLKGSEDIAFKKCVERFEKMAKEEKNNEVFKSYKRISGLKAKERAKEQKKTKTEAMKPQMAPEEEAREDKEMTSELLAGKGEETREEEANADSQIQKLATDLIEKRDWEEQKKTMAAANDDSQIQKLATDLIEKRDWEKQKKTMAAANDDSQIQKLATDLIEKRDWEGAFSVVLHARSRRLAHWIMEEASGDVSQLGLSQAVLISLLHQLYGGILLDNIQATLKFMDNVVSCFDTLSWSSFNRGTVVGILEAVKEALEHCIRLDKGGEVLLETLQALHF